MEYGVGSLLTPSHMAINLGLLEDDMTKYKQDRWFSAYYDNTIGKSCAGERPLPMAASNFDEMMDEKVIKDGASLPKIEFTVEDDRSLIKGLYRKTFESVIGRAVKLDWHGLGWEHEMSELMPVLIAAAGTLKELDLSLNKLRGAARCARLLNQTYTKTHERTRRRHPGVYRQPHEPQGAQSLQQPAQRCVC